MNADFIRWQAPATDSGKGRKLLAEISADEYESANLISREYFSRNLDELDVRRLRVMVQGIKQDREQANPPASCFQCGCHVPAGGFECRPCHEGIAPHRYTA